MLFPRSEKFYSRTDLFISKNSQFWNELIKLNNTPLKGWSSNELRAFPGYFRKLCDHLNYAKEQQLSNKIILFLNELVGRSHQVLYQKNMSRMGNLGRYFFRDIPELLRKAWAYILISAFLFIGSFSLTFLFTAKNPEFAQRVIDQQTLTLFEEMYAEDIFEDKSLSSRFSGAAYYIQHNTSIAYLSFAAGVFLGIGSLYFLLFNGLFLGAIAGYVHNTGGSLNFWSFVTAHSAFELSGLIIAGAAGLLLGWTIIHPGLKKRKTMLLEQIPQIVGILIPSSFFLFCAAIIESSISPLPVSLQLRGTIAVISLMMILGYSLLGVWRKK